MCLPLNREQPGELEAVFEAVRQRWGRLDILLHSIAFAPTEDLQGGLLGGSAEGFKRALDVSMHSFVRMAKLAPPYARRLTGQTLCVDGGVNIMG